MVRAGLQTSDDFRFVRAWWEVPSNCLVEGTAETTQQRYRDQTFGIQRWVTLSKGGGASPFLSEFYLVVDWHKDGQAMKAWNDQLGEPFQGTIYFIPGVPPFKAPARK